MFDRSQHSVTKVLISIPFFKLKPRLKVGVTKT